MSEPITRRDMLACSAAALGSLALAGLGGIAYASEEGSSDDPILVTVFLRGGADGLGILAPADDPNYAAARPGELRIVDRGEKAGIPVAQSLADSDFRFHHQAQALKELYDSKALAVVHACGLKHGTRSHFDAQDMMERGITDPGQPGRGTGWLTRVLEASSTDEVAIPAVALGSAMPISLLGCFQASAINNLHDFRLWNGEFRRPLRRLYEGDSLVNRAGTRTLDTLDLIEARLRAQSNDNKSDYIPLQSANYSMSGRDSELSRPLRQLAQLIKMEIGIKAATVDLGGWDTHEQQPYRFQELVQALSRGLMAFYNDLAAYHKRLTVIVLSEFGRRLKSNQSNGTDHGHGNVLFVLGGSVAGGKFHGTWPGLHNEQLDGGADLAVTTDYRAVLSEVLKHHKMTNRISAVLPNYEGSGLPGLFT